MSQLRFLFYFMDSSLTLSYFHNYKESFTDNSEPLLLCVITLGNMSTDEVLAVEIGEIPNLGQLLITAAETHVLNCQVVSAVYMTLSHLSRQPSMAHDLWIHGLDQVTTTLKVVKSFCRCF